MLQFPHHLILSDRVYKVSVSKANGDRASNRGLIDFRVNGVNPLISSDSWKTLIGMSDELFLDYPSYNQPMPLEWVLFRFLCHYVRTNSVHILSSPGGGALLTTTFKDYLGREISDNDAEKILCIILGSWVRVFPDENIALCDIYASTDITFHVLKRGINSLKFLGHVKEINQDTYIVKPSILDNLSLSKSLTSLDRKINRYYQEIEIEATEPFCFVIMPFREEEFQQRIYTEVIKPTVRNFLGLSCYRVDEDNLPDRIENKIYSYLLKAAFVIAEVTTLNSNVFYELGLAHMLEKDCIILSQKPIHEIPFDINRIRVGLYNGDEQLVEILKKSISALAFKIK